ncbi:MAG: hypothetical protein WCK67_04505 [bacterium]
MKNFVITAIILFLAIFMPLNSVRSEVFKQIKINKGDVYILKFSENFKKIEVGNAKALKVEQNTKIFNDDYELIISAMQAEDTNLIVWTKTNLYIYKILITKQKQIKKNNEASLIEIDKPPLKPLKLNDNMIIDQPPQFKAK